MSARAKAKKVQGVVVDGRVRDLSEHRSMEYPVSLYSTQCIKLPIKLSCTRCLPSRIPPCHKMLL